MNSQEMITVGQVFGFKPKGWTVKFKAPPLSRQQQMWVNITEKNMLKDGEMNFSVHQSELFDHGPENAARYFAKQIAKHGCTEIRCDPYWD